MTFLYSEWNNLSVLQHPHAPMGRIHFISYLLTRVNKEGIEKMLKSGMVIGSSSIKYLEEKGFPELAIEHERDKQNKFSLALAAGNLESALRAAMDLKEKDCFNKLAVEALKQGRVPIVEVCYQKMMAFEKLAFLYLITGNTLKLKKLLILAKTKLKDSMLQYSIALMLGDIEEQAKVLADIGLFSLSYTLSKNHGLNKIADPLKRAIEEKGNIRLPTTTPLGSIIIDRDYVF